MKPRSWTRVNSGSVFVSRCDQWPTIGKYITFIDRKERQNLKKGDRQGSLANIDAIRDNCHYSSRRSWIRNEDAGRFVTFSLSIFMLLA